MDLHSRGVQAILSAEGSSLLALGFVEDRLLVESERCSKWPVIALP